MFRPPQGLPQGLAPSSRPASREPICSEEWEGHIRPQERIRVCPHKSEEEAEEVASPARHVVRQRTSSATFSPWQRRSTCTKDRAPGPAPLEASTSGVSAGGGRGQEGGEGEVEKHETVDA